MHDPVQQSQARWLLGRLVVERFMYCESCQQHIANRGAKSIRLLAGEIRHCPWCLDVLSQDDRDDDEAVDTDPDWAADELDSMRRRIRDKFVERLARSAQGPGSAAGPAKAIACPLCDRALAVSEVTRLRNDDHFSCPGCHRDLAAYAYRQEVYGEQRWLPVIYALGDLSSDLTCARCSVLGAIANACRDALAHIPKFLPEQHRLLGTMLARADWRPPDPACRESCIAIKQYQSTVGQPLLLL